MVQRILIIEKKCSIIYIFPDDPNNEGKEENDDRENDDEDDDKNDIINIVDPEQRDYWKRIRIEILKLEKQLGIVFSIQFERNQYYKFIMMYYFYYVQKKLKQYESYYESIRE